MAQQYSIKDLEQLSGIKAHTIRIWEQRYSMFHPQRSETNIRSYSAEDLKSLLNIALLKNNGFKISKVAKMREEEIQDKVRSLTEITSAYTDQIQALILAMIDVDEDRFEKIMSNSILKMGFENTMLHIIYPFLSNVGVLWLTGSVNPAQEHFITHLIRQKIIVAIDGQYVDKKDDGLRYMLYLPEGELHELSLLFGHYMIRSRHHQSMYLGQSLPLTDAKKVYDVYKPDFVVTVITAQPGQSKIQAYVNDMAKAFENTNILLSGRQVIGQDLALAENMTIMNQPSDLLQYIEE